MKDLTFDEYKKRVQDGLRKYLKVFPKEEVEAYLKEQEKRIEESYEEDKELIKLGYAEGFDPAALVYVLSLEF